MDRVQAKINAKAQLSGNWGIAVGSFLVVGIACMAGQVFSIIPIIGWAIPFILSGVWSVGYANLARRFEREQEVSVGDGFIGFEQFIKSICLGLVVNIFIFLWSLLLLIPGIIKSLSYSMVYYVMLDNPELSVMEAIDRSKELTYGHKWELFVTGLSFIGWAILAVMSFGIGYLWLIPYMQTTMANIYAQLKSEYIADEKESII